MITVLAGGVGAARMLSGIVQVVRPSEVTAVVNVADDDVMHGLHISPDLDTVTYTLAGAIDPERGWGLRDETWRAMEALGRFRAVRPDGSQAAPTWFNLGDQDLAVCLQRARRLAEGARLTETLDELRQSLGVEARVLPPTDEPVRTQIRARGEWFGFQDYMIRQGAPGPVEGVEVLGAGAAVPTLEALDAIASASTVVIGPSNPVISIGPILAVGGIADALRATAAPVVAVSPLVRGAVLKGPTDLFLQWAGHPLNADGIVAHYEGLIDGLVSDERATGVPTLETAVEMGDADARRRVALETLVFAAALRG